MDKKGDEAPFAHFQSLEKSRKRRLSWIPKTGGSFEGVGSGNLPGFGHDLHVDTIEEELPSAPIVAHLTREEKSKAKKEAEDYQEAGMCLGMQPPSSPFAFLYIYIYIHLYYMI